MTAAYYLEWVGLVLRWFHFMMGVAWIGASFYFVWLNNSVRSGPEDAPGVAGGLWSVHGGAFYQVTKYAGAPARLPDTLHWFKWEAYLTWWSGFGLLVLHWWSSPGTTLVDPSVAGLGPAEALGIGVATVFGGWLVYDGLCRSPLKDRGAVLAGVLLGLVVGVAWALAELLSPRAAYLHVGVMLGTWMAANVFFVIIPGQRAIVDAMTAGRPPPVERGRAGALRSLHNNYLTLPVLFVMISGHFPQTWGHPRGWAILAALALVGAAWRHWVNLEERGVHRRWMPAAVVAGLVGIAVLARPTPAIVSSGAERVRLAEVLTIVANRCLPCHATEPLHPGFATPPKGLVLEEPRQVRAAGALIHQQVVATHTMPLGNLTGMTEAERETIARWVGQEGLGP